ncbi:MULTISPECIES: ribbon-helix-helix domain-containing protein [Pseudomonas]|jgi:predicted DNA-binding ribbon-helix-helix protein|uniref:Ribbon-helix-helix domain-containing protein n=1 Tax=Pseudomonas monsensis TaxID=2745509 RepID=A0ABT3YSR6_9PSED|nr:MULTISPECIES: ribbon-helix-helix domain-containing protein [Pseudomonas]MCY0108515.1 ribbon-helix-helix domain-containing protein [Pseudomonas monsensis]PTS92335.1 aryl-sulfate sulfotransferase [Pseudomonas sp. HMWF006]PTT88204.1 aryl-sulfate sulfotransferase [Pseudomonas sp. HMWF005]
MVDGDRRGDSHTGVPHALRVDSFVNEFDMSLIRPLSRSVRLNGYATCLRLEQVYWNILGQMAADNRCSVSSLLSRVDREVQLRHGGVKNFSALVRVVCVMNGAKEKAPAIAL